MTIPPIPLPAQALGAAVRILVVKLDGVGDFVLAVPFLRGLRAAAPKAAIALVVLPSVAPLTVGCPHVDMVVSPRGDPFSSKLEFQGRTPEDLSAFATAFKAGFDIAVVPRFDLDNKGATPIIAASRAPVRLAFSEFATPWKAESNRGFDAAYTHVLPGGVPRHEVAYNQALLEALGGTATGTDLELYLGDDEIGQAQALIRAGFGGERPPRLIAVAVTSGSRRKNYPVDRFAILLNCVAASLSAAVVVVGAPGEAAGTALTNALRVSRIYLPPGPTIRRDAAIFAVADAVIAVDTGPSHIAAAAGVPVAVLSCHPAGGNPVAPLAPERYHPVGRHVLVLRPAAAVPPCTDMCVASGAHCVSTIDPLAAAKQIEGFLKPLFNNDFHQTT